MRIRDIIGDLIWVVADLIGVAAIFGTGYALMVIGYGVGL